MISSKRPIVVYIEQARIPDETTSITRSEVPITGDIVVHHRIQNGANNKAMGDGFLKELYDVLNGAVGENLRFEDGHTLSLTNERVLVKDGDSEVVFAPASYNADDIQFTDTKQTLSGFTVARSDYADSDSSKTYLVEGTDRNFLAVTNNEDLLNSILQVQ